MRLTIRSIGIETHANARTWQPDDPDRVAARALVDIGPKKSKGADTFSVRVATPLGLAELKDRGGIIACRALVVMRRYSFDDLYNWLEATVASCEDDTWSACVDRLRLYFDWEFENYTEH
jgi:hypothetical protein